VEGHACHEMNESADALARFGMEPFKMKKPDDQVVA
jgi:ribonuclease HI